MSAPQNPRYPELRVADDLRERVQRFETGRNDESDTFYRAATDRTVLVGQLDRLARLLRHPLMAAALPVQDPLREARYMEYPRTALAKELLRSFETRGIPGWLGWSALMSTLRQIELDAALPVRQDEPYGGHPDFGPRVMANQAQPSLAGWEALAKDALLAWEECRTALRATEPPRRAGMSKHSTDDATRIVALREAITAANGDWHDVTALWSIQNDLDWLLARAEAALPTATEPPE